MASSDGDGERLSYPELLIFFISIDLAPFFRGTGKMTDFSFLFWR